MYILLQFGIQPRLAEIELWLIVLLTPVEVYLQRRESIHKTRRSMIIRTLSAVTESFLESGVGWAKFQCSRVCILANETSCIEHREALRWAL